MNREVHVRFWESAGLQCLALLAYQNAVVELIRSKRAGLPGKPAARFVEPARVVNIMDALRRSLEQEQRAAAPKAPAPAEKRRKRVAGQTEMLLPITGKKEKEPSVKPATRSKAGQKKAG